MVIAIGRGGQMDVADQFKNLNAGAIDISYEQSTDSSSSNSKGSSKSGSTNKSSGGNSESKGNQRDPGGFGGGQGMPQMPGGSSGGGSQGMPQMPGGGMQGGFGGFMAGGNNNNDSSKINQEKITLSEDDMDDLKTFLPGISDITISYTTKSEVDGGDLDEAESYTIAG